MTKTVLRKSAGLLAVALFLPAIAFAQVVPIEGSVKMKGADGKLTPVPGITIDIYRRDIKGHWGDLKTDKKGEYRRLGMAIQGLYLVIVYGPGIRPTYADSVRPGQAPVDFIVEAGDGQTLTYDEVIKQAGQLKSAPPGATAPPAMSAQERAKLEADQKARKEAEAKNEELQQNFDQALKHFNQGVELKKNKNYEGAVSEFEAAGKVDPSKHGALAEVSHRANANLAETHRSMGIDLYNQKQKEPAKAQFEAGLVAIKKAIEVAPLDNEKEKAKLVNTNLIVYYDIESKLVRLLVEQCGQNTYIEDEVKELDKVEAIDAPNKNKWETVKGDLYRSGGNTDNAVAAYKSVLGSDPNNLDALFGAGLTLLASEDKAKLQESANYLADFVAKAPATDKRVADAKATLDALKAANQVEAEKPAKRGKGKP